MIFGRSRPWSARIIYFGICLHQYSAAVLLALIYFAHCVSCVSVDQFFFSYWNECVFNFSPPCFLECRDDRVVLAKKPRQALALLDPGRPVSTKAKTRPVPALGKENPTIGSSCPKVVVTTGQENGPVRENRMPTV